MRNFYILFYTSIVWRQGTGKSLCSVQELTFIIFIIFCFSKSIHKCHSHRNEILRDNEFSGSRIWENTCIMHIYGIHFWKINIHKNNYIPWKFHETNLQENNHHAQYFLDDFWMLLSHFLIRVLHKIHYTAHIHGVLVWLIKYILANKMLMPTFCIMLESNINLYMQLHLHLTYTLFTLLLGSVLINSLFLRVL